MTDDERREREAIARFVAWSMEQFRRRHPRGGRPSNWHPPSELESALRGAHAPRADRAESLLERLQRKAAAG